MRCHLNAKTAIQTCTQLLDENLAVLAPYLTFGDASGPYEWGVFPGIICDLSQAIMQCEDWNPAVLQTPLGKLVPSGESFDDEMPFVKGRALIVEISVNPKGTAVICIDNTTVLSVDLEGSDNMQQLETGTLFVVHCASRDFHPKELIERKDRAVIAKLLAEGGAEETT